MLVLTFQKKSIAQQIKSKTYHVDMNRSTFAYNSLRFTIGYRKITNELSKKGLDLLSDEGVIWGWVSSPSQELVKNYLRKGYVALFIDIDPSKCVMSDYYKFSDYVLGDSTDKDFIVESSQNSKQCVQCSFTIDSVYSVRAEYDCSVIILYNSIVRSFYAMQTLYGVKHHVQNSISMYLTDLSHYMCYQWNKILYVLDSICQEYSLNYRSPRFTITKG